MIANHSGPIAISMDNICMCLFSGSESPASSFQSISASLFLLPRGGVRSMLQFALFTSLKSCSRSTKVLLFWPSLGASAPKTLSVQGFCGPFQRDTAPFGQVGCMIPPSPFILAMAAPFSAGFRNSPGCCYGWANVSPNARKAESTWGEEAWI